MEILAEKPLELRPLSEMPVWARLAFAKRIPDRYFWDEDATIPRMMSEVTFIGFERSGENEIYPYYSMEWIINDRFVTINYSMTLLKNIS